jgi:large subunit ribosomal protein L10
MKSKTQKSEELAKLKKKLPESKISVFTSFSPSTGSASSRQASSGQGKAGEKGLSVAQMTELKRLLRSLGAEYFVTKKTLIDLAIKDKNYDGLDIYSMDGSVGMVLGGDDPYLVAKKVYEFSKKNQSLRFWGALFDGKFLGKDGFLEIAKMPSKEVLIGRLLGMLTYPMRGLAVALGEIAKKRIS